MKVSAKWWASLTPEQQAHVEAHLHSRTVGDFKRLFKAVANLETRCTDRFTYYKTFGVIVSLAGDRYLKHDPTSSDPYRFVKCD